MKDKELKPCAHCGSENISFGYVGQPATTFFVCCMDCGARGGDSSSCQTPSGIPLPESPDEALKKWNTRTSNKQIEELKEKNKILLKELCDIQGMCIGELTMNYKLDAEDIGCGISKVTGMTHPELLAFLEIDK